MCLRKFGTGLRSIMLLCLAFLVLVPHISLADVTLTDEEYKELDQRLMKAEERQEKSNKIIQKLENELSQARSEQKNSNKTINSLKNDLKQAKESQEKSNKKIQKLEMNLDAVEKFSRKQKKEQTKKIIKTAAISFISGTATGILIDKVVDYIRK